MCAPMRYTTRHRSVKRIFSFSSGTLNRLGSLGAVIGAQPAMVPPACSIFERAEADTVTPFTLNLRCTSPMPSSLMGRSGRRTSPAPNSVSGVTSAPSASWPRCRTLTTCAGCLNGFVKPRFGMRRMSGICPPSKPGRVCPPVRAVWPLPPRPAVLPIPEPGPRPLRMRARCEPGGLRRLDSVMCGSSGLGAFARGFLFGLTLVFAFGFAIAYSLTRRVGGGLELGAALLGAPPSRREVLERIQRGADHVVRVGGAEALGEDVAHTGALEHRAHGAAGDDAGPGRGGLQEHASGAVVTDDFMRDGRARERDLDHAAAGGFDGLAHRLAHLVRFAGGDPDAPLPVAHGDERVEAEAPAALHHFRDAVDGNDVLDEPVALALPLARVAPLPTAPPTPTAPTPATPPPSP